MIARDRLTGPSALQAFRADIPLGEFHPTPEDQSAVVVATLLRQSLSSDDPTAERVRNEAWTIARDVLGPSVLSQGCTYDDHAAESIVDVVRLLAQGSEHAGRVRLAQHLLESLSELHRESIIAGRILADRARNSRKQGHVSLSFEQGQELFRLARRVRSSELRALAHVTRGALAQARGNFVEVREQFSLALRVADTAGHRRLQAVAHGGIGIADGVSGHFGDAVSHLWQAYEICAGFGQIAREALGNLGQTLLVSGRPAEARKVLSLLLAKSPPLQTVIPALGGYALASARLGDSQGVQWANGEVRKLSRTRHHPREVAEALLECAAAYEIIGKVAQGGVLKRRAMAMAAHHGYHSLTFDESIAAARGPALAEFTEPAKRVTAAIVEIDVPDPATTFRLALV